MQTVCNTYWDAGKGNMTAQNTRKPFGGRGSASDPAEGAYSAPANPLVGGEGWFSPPKNRIPCSRPFGPRLSYPHSKISSDAIENVWRTLDHFKKAFLYLSDYTGPDSFCSTVFIFSYFSFLFFGSCGRLSWLNRQYHHITSHHICEYAAVQIKVLWQTASECFEYENSRSLKLCRKCNISKMQYFYHGHDGEIETDLWLDRNVGADISNVRPWMSRLILVTILCLGHIATRSRCA